MEAGLEAHALPHANARTPLTERLFPNNEWVLVLVIVAECIIFGVAGHNFATAGNAFEIELNVALAFVPIAVIVVKQTTTIRASITAYSTAVGPSSETSR